jgi:cation/acetate symporter
MTPAATNIGQPNPTAIVFFFLFVAVSLAITYWAAQRTRSTDDFFVASHRITGLQNGFALAGDFLSAAGFLGVAGYTSLVGFDGLLYAIGAMMGWPVMMFLLAEPLRNLGKYTFADVVSYRLDSTAVRVMAAISALSLVLMYLILQMVGTGTLIHLLFGLGYESAVVITGGIMAVYVLFGGMIATTWVQIIKCVLMLFAAVVLALLVLAHFGFSFVEVFKEAAVRNGPGVLVPGQVAGPWETVSLGLSFAFGIAALPHVLMRFYTVPDARAARRSLLYATAIIGGFGLLLFIIGFGAMALVGSDVIRAVDRGGNMAVPLLAEQVGGTAFLGFVAAVSFATILAVVSGLVITGAATLSHDLWTHAVRGGAVSQREQIVLAKTAVVALCVISIVLGIVFKGQNIAFLVGLSTAVAASANFPVLALSIFWRRLTTPGAVTGIATGLGASLLLIYMSPLIQVDILHNAQPVIALRNPAIISIPLAFCVTILVSLATRRLVDQKRDALIEWQMLMGTSDT